VARASRAAAFAAVFIVSARAASAAAPPKVAITAPKSGASLSGTVLLSARAAAAAGLAGVQFQLDGADLGGRLSVAPYTFSWDTTQAANSGHRLTAVAWDIAGSSAVSAAVPVSVDNAPLILSEVSAIDVLENSATITWKTSRPADSQAEYGATTAYSSSTILEEEPTLAHSATLNGLSPATTYHYRAKSKGAAGLAVASEDFTFATTAPIVDTTPPTVAIMNPPSGAFVSSTVTVTANASDNVGVAAVQFMLDGIELGAPVTAAPFLFSWNTVSVADGTHVLAAIARDAAGNSATSVVSVAVSNTPPVIGAPTIGAASPDRVDLLWTTDQRSDSAVSYGPTTAYGFSTPTISALSTGHGVTLTGLASATQYHYQVRSRNAAGVLAVSGDYTFATPGSSTGTAAGGDAAGLAAADPSSAKAPQKFLTPATPDGINDDAVFGPGAQEVWIYDVRGKQVFHGTSSGPGSPVVWNCRDASGRIVPSGVYVAKIRTRDSGLVYQSFAVAK
jgi:Big-like domain-containing protein/purple acid phosphatase-like protein